MPARTTGDFMHRRILTAAAVVAILQSGTAHAYLDPGAGSMLLQILLGGVAGVLVAFRLFRHRISQIFRRDRQNHD